MRKMLLTLCGGLFITALSAASGFAQHNGRAFYKQPYKSRNSGSFSRNTGILSFGYGFPNESGTGYDYWINGNRADFGPAYVKYEHGIIDEIGIGGYAGFAASRYRYSKNNVDHATAFGMGALGYYHFNKLIPVRQLDVYAGVGIGFRARSFTETRNKVKTNGTDFDVLPVAKAGARWYFTQLFGVYAEVGYDQMSDVNIGINLRF